MSNTLQYVSPREEALRRYEKAMHQVRRAIGESAAGLHNRIAKQAAHCEQAASACRNAIGTSRGLLAEPSDPQLTAMAEHLTNRRNELLAYVPRQLC